MKLFLKILFRKNRRIVVKPQNNSGIILIIVLWIMVILSLLAVGLSRKVKVDLTLTKYAIGKMKSRYITMAGLTYAMGQIKKDNKDPTTATVDTKYQCGFSKDNQTVEDLFEKKAVGDGYFIINYRVPDDKMTFYGFEDEESKINLNALNSGNYNILTYLISELGFENVADSISSSVVDWIDADNDVFNSPAGAEDEEYQGRPTPYHCKNKPFDSIEELLLVKEMTPEIFKKIKNYVTVFPRQGNLAVNFNTASEAVLKAIGRSVSGAQRASISDTDNLVERFISYRRGDDGQWPSEDDRVIDGNKMGLNEFESGILGAMSQNRTQVSNYLRVHVKGVDEVSAVSTYITAVIQRSDLSVLSSHRD